MEESLTAEMPRVWEDANGWETYYRAMPLEDRWERSREDALRHLALIMELGSRRKEDLAAVWVAGSGCTALGQMLSLLSLDVHVTDVSESAIAWQNSDELRGIAQELTASFQKSLGSPKPGRFIAEVHDFRRLYREEAFDIVFNCRAIQGFTLRAMREVARTHHAATRPRGDAVFITQNVQGTDRDELEQSLADAGFYVPLLRSNRWHRQVLRETGIPHVFVLGQPFIPMVGEYQGNESKWEQDIATLRGFSNEYEERCEAEWHETREVREGTETRKAHVVYNTG